jgi:hypothetical protein
VALAGGQEAKQGDTLRRHPVLVLPEPAHQLFKSDLWIGHG